MKASKYVSQIPDANGICHYPVVDHETWQILYERQTQIIQNRACDEYIEGLNLLNMSPERIPQVHEINTVLQNTTGWSVKAVPSLISSEKFFTLLANRQFPAATFIRDRTELDYLQEPDIFHEIYGHCPLLTNQNYANFVECYAKLSLTAKPQEQNKLLRLFWMTVEFGLVDTPKGTRIYGGGILSSKEETIYALESDKPKRLPFDVLSALRTPYRIDIKQPIYFIIPGLKTFFDILQMDIMSVVHKAFELGSYEPEFPV